MIKEIKEENIEKATAVNASFEIFFFVESDESKVEVNNDITPNRRVNKIEKIVSNAFETSIEK